MQYPKKKWMSKNHYSDSTSFPKLIKKLDLIFSKYIRIRDADKNGICRCVTCSKRFFWKEGDAGHFVHRDRKATRFDTRNCHAQCSYCNRFRSGNQYLHGEAIDRICGNGTAAILQALGRARGTKITAYWLEQEIEKFKKLLKEEKKKLAS